jgi:hypothetical protein
VENADNNDGGTAVEKPKKEKEKKEKKEKKVKPAKEDKKKSKKEDEGVDEDMNWNFGGAEDNSEEKNDKSEDPAIKFDIFDIDGDMEKSAETPVEKTAEPTASEPLSFVTGRSANNEDTTDAPFIVSKAMGEVSTTPTATTITPVSTGDSSAPVSRPTPISNEERASNIARLAEQIERKRQANIAITDGKAENKFTTPTASQTTGEDPKVVARKITETVSTRSADTTPKMGFTAQKITETRTGERTYSGLGVNVSNTTRSATASSGDTSKKKADDILSALEKLRNSMKKPQ